ncbi:MAG TPA: hypothetical protein VFM34_06695 [Moraxellaceae bacterium]|nr:hypothetical protein [Moraxellaceae bacterium]
MNLATLLRWLETEQARLAQDALQQPAARDLFEYGRVVGLYAGLERAKDVLIENLREQERKTFDL